MAILMPSASQYLASVNADLHDQYQKCNELSLI